jgi:hypothetical protein
MTTQEKSRLVTVSSDPTLYTDVQEVDARTALARGLAEYIAQLRVDAPGGRHIQFKRVFPHWAVPEEDARYPSAIVYSTATGVYEPARLTPSLPDSRNKIVGSTNSYLISASSLQLNLTVEIWATDPEERSALVMNLERLLNPVDWMYGFRLELPYYFNQRATFSLLDMSYDDSEENAMRRYRKASFTMASEVPVCNVFKYPMAKPRFRLDEIGTDVVLDPSTEVT